MKTIWYYFFKILLKTSLFFMTKKIIVNGKENIPKKGAVLFMVNHPNGLLDPLIVTTNNPRTNYFLTRAASFKKPLVRWFLNSLNLIPIYRIRDGVSQLNKNKGVFEKCFNLLNNHKALMIFPEGSHDKRRSVRRLSKGFTRIVFGAMERNPKLQIQIIPVGITYQNSSTYPFKVSLNSSSIKSIRKSRNFCKVSRSPDSIFVLTHSCTPYLACMSWISCTILFDIYFLHNWLTPIFSGNIFPCWINSFKVVLYHIFFVLYNINVTSFRNMITTCF